MASNLPPQWVVFILTGILFLASSVNSIPTEELDSMLDTLRIRGYELFCNAIVTSDLQIEILYGKNDTRSHRSFTFFAPMDSSLFALDMTQSATSYIDTLRFHIVPRRLSITNLLGLPAGFSLPTLLFRRYLNVTQSPESVSVGGVDVTFPGLFYGRHVAVHGLNGIISLRSNTATETVSGFQVGFPNRRSSPPRSGFSSSESHSVMAPRPTARPPGENIPPVNRKAHAPAREPANADSHFQAASPFHRAIHPPESDELDPLEMIHVPEHSRSHAASPFNQAAYPPKPHEPNSLDNIMIHPPEGSHSRADLPFNRAVYPPESDEPNSPENTMVLPPEDGHSYAASPFNQAADPPKPHDPNSLDNIMIHAPEDSHSRADLPFNRVVYPPESDEPNSLENTMVLPPEDGHSYAASPINQAVHPPKSHEPNSLDNLMIGAPEDSHFSAASQFNQAVFPPDPDESNSLDNQMIHALDASHLLAHSPVIHGIPPASSTELPANVYVPPPVLSHAFTTTSESLGYRYSSISAPPLEYSDAEVPTAVSPDVWLPKKHGVALIETFKGDSNGLIKVGHYADEVLKMPQLLTDVQEMSEKYKPSYGAAHCVDPDVGLAMQYSAHQRTTCRYVCE